MTTRYKEGDILKCVNDHGTNGYLRARDGTPIGVVIHRTYINDTTGEKREAISAIPLIR